MLFGPKPFEQKPPMAYEERSDMPIIPRVIKNFPYIIRYCIFCEQEMEVLNAVHVNGQEEIYKCLMICFNENCGAYDEEAKSAYIRVYYSSELALKTFETVMLKIQRLEKS